LVIRKNADDLADWIDRAQRMYYLLGVDIAYRPAIIRFPSGAQIRTGHLKDEQSYTKYMGQEFHMMVIEELTQIPFEKRYLQLIASCRSTIPELKPQVFATTNPGGIGHGWVKRRFVDPAPPMTEFEAEGRTRIYIPATVEDNPSLFDADPGYIKTLESLKNTDEELWKAWRLGDWNTFAGQFFKEFRTDLHVIKPFKAVKTAENVIVGGMDWGRTAPFAFTLSEIKVVNFDESKFYRARTFFEIYGTNKTPRAWAEIIKENLRKRKLKLSDISWTRGDPAMFTKGQDMSISIADQFRNEDISIKPASNDRIGGWENLHNWMSIAPDGLPYWMITEDCINLIKELPELVHDENNVEDVDTDGIDHACFCRHTPILTDRGYKAIIEVCKGDMVWTPLGWSKVLWQGKTGIKKVINFQSMKVTSNHPFLTQDGFHQLKNLRETDKLWNVFISSVNPTDVIHPHQSFPIKAILGVVQRRMQKVTIMDFMFMSGNTLTERYPRVFMFITKMVIMMITLLKIWKYTLIPSIKKYIGEKTELINWFIQKPILKSPEFMLVNGMVAKRDINFINDLPKSHGKKGKRKTDNVKDVKNYIGRGQDYPQNSAVLTAKCLCSGDVEVYSIETDTGMFTAHNAIVSNSDASRYCFKHLKWIDAKLGGIKYKQVSPAIKKRSPLYYQGQIMPDPSKFATAGMKRSKIGGLK